MESLKRNTELFEWFTSEVHFSIETLYLGGDTQLEEVQTASGDKTKMKMKYGEVIRNVLM